MQLRSDGEHTMDGSDPFSYEFHKAKASGHSDPLGAATQAMKQGREDESRLDADGGDALEKAFQQFERDKREWTPPGNSRTVAPVVNQDGHDATDPVRLDGEDPLDYAIRCFESARTKWAPPKSDRDR